jgi:site-specific recombinase XerD
VVVSLQHNAAVFALTGQKRRLNTKLIDPFTRQVSEEKSLIMSIKSKLKHTVIQLLKQDRLGSFATRHDRRGLILRFAEDLVKLGYKVADIQNIKLKHIEAVTHFWQNKKLSNATIKNRLSALRHLSILLRKPGLVPSNQALNIGKRNYVSTRNRALYQPDFSKITHPYLRVSLELQRVFGLRREESLKIKPHLADKRNSLELSPSWCKGGRGRYVPILTEDQRYWLDKAKEVAGRAGNSLIPPDKNYIRHRYCYDKQVQQAGLRNLHGLRHAYAQRRYKELTGWEAPINGGPPSKDFTPEQKEIDRQARMVLTEELGHGRVQIVKNYCG